MNLRTRTRRYRVLFRPPDAFCRHQLFADYTRRVKKLKLQERRAVIPCRRSLAACRPLGFLGRSVVPIVDRRPNGGRRMEWARILAYITGTVDQELLLRNEYLAAENRILRGQLKGRLK